MFQIDRRFSPCTKNGTRPLRFSIKLTDHLELLIMFGKKVAAAVHGPTHDELADKIKKLEAENLAAVELSQSLTTALESQGLQFESKLHECRHTIKDLEHKHNALLDAIRTQYPDFKTEFTTTTQADHHLHHDVPNDKITVDGPEDKSGAASADELSRLKLQMEKLVETNGHLAQEMQQYEMKLTEAEHNREQQIGQLQNQCEELRRQHQIELQKCEQTVHDQFRKSEAELTDKLQRLILEKTDIDEALKRSEQQRITDNTELQQKLHQAESELVAVRQEMDEVRVTSTAVRNETREKITITEQQLDQTRSELNNVNQILAQVRAQLDSERDHAAVMAADLEQTQSRLNRTLDDTQNQTRIHAAIMNNLLSECEETQARFEITRIEHAAVIDQLQRRLDAESQIVQQTRDQVQALIISKQQDQEVIRNQDLKITTLQEQIEVGRRELDMTQETLTKTKSELSVTLTQLEQVQKQVDALDTERNNLSIQSARLQDQCHEVQQQCEQLQQQCRLANERAQVAEHILDDRVRDVEHRARHDIEAHEKASIERQNELKKALKSAQSELDSVIKSLHDEQRHSKDITEQLSEALADKIAMSKRVNCLEAELQQHLDADIRRDNENSGLIGGGRHDLDSGHKTWRQRLDLILPCIPQRAHADPMDSLWDEDHAPAKHSARY